MSRGKSSETTGHVSERGGWLAPPALALIVSGIVDGRRDDGVGVSRRTRVLRQVEMTPSGSSGGSVELSRSGALAQLMRSPLALPSRTRCDSSGIGQPCFKVADLSRKAMNSPDRRLFVGACRPQPSSLSAGSGQRPFANPRFSTTGHLTLLIWRKIAPGAIRAAIFMTRL
jgi:hypothetical protein